MRISTMPCLTRVGESTFDGTLSTTQPLVVDSDGSLKPSLLGMNARGIFELWLNNGTAFETCVQC